MLRFIKRHKIVVITLFFVLISGLVIGASYYSVNKYKNELMTMGIQIQNLENALNNIGDLQIGYVVTQSVRAGDQITEDVIQQVDVPVKLGLNLVTSADEIIGKYFRVSLSDGTVLTKEDIVDERIDNTQRYYDVVLDEIPIGLKEGDYIDIRITFPFGEDFIAIAHKKVIQLNSGIPKLILNESEIFTYQSMLVDKAIYPGAKIYAVAYYDAGAQPTAEVYYPLNKNLAELSTFNPNLIELVKQEMILKRAQVDELMGGGLETKTEEQLEMMSREIDRLRAEIGRSIARSQAELSRRLALEARNAN